MESLIKHPEFDEDGYPTEETEKEIREWDFHDFAGLMQFVQRAWHYGAEYFKPTTEHMWEVSTGGWSGNESLIAAMKANTIFWALCWVSSRRGGHYEFKVRPIAKSDAKGGA